MQPVSRLIDFFVPEHYNISLDIDRKGRRFQGVVEITGTSGGDRILVHAHELVINDVAIDGTPAVVTLGDNDEVTLTQDEPLAAGLHMVRITYSGTITDSLHGLYPCYFEHDGAKKELLITQLESHYAREVFPCLDEPAAKATFDITVTTETGITVLGNMPIREQQEQDNRLTTQFDTTPRMSTYLVALVMGELHSQSATTTSGVTVTTWATPAQPASSLTYALQEAVSTIEFFDDYFGVPYPLPKADHVAVPDFSAGAMENWGLITYRETALIVDEQHSSLVARQYVSAVIAHELSHQWFGNLVTMKWWNNLWLNESFASIMEVIAPNALHPEWHSWLDFDTSSAVAALRRDAIDGVQSVQIDVNHPDEIQSIFDGAIVYSKGARLLRMMMSYVGESAFRAGLTTYFTEHAYGNTDERDLWRALAVASGKDIDGLMTAWISQPGYPVVHAAKSGGQLRLSQTRFFVGPHGDDDTQWPIPLDADDPLLPALLDQLAVSLDYPSSSLLLNQHNTAHFITHYDDALFAELLDRLTNGVLDTGARLQLLNEQILLARGGQISPARLVDTLLAYEHETEEPVWDAILMAINELKKYIEHDEAAERQLRLLAGRLARPLYERLGWESIADEPDNDRKLRSRIISQMVYSEDQSVIDEAIRRSTSAPLEALDPELRGLFLSVAIRYGDDRQLLTALIDRYKTETSPDLKEDIRGALTSARRDDDIQTLLAILTDTTVVRPQDTTYWYIYLQSNRSAREAAWQWLRDNWPWIDETFGTDKSYDYYPRYAGQLLMTRRQLDEYTTFFTPMLSNVGLKRTIEMGIADLSGRVELIEHNQTTVCERLKALS